MIFKNVEIFNIREMVKNEEGDGYILKRFPSYCEADMLEQGINMNRSSIGVEFRFKFKGEVSFKLKSKNPEGARACLYLGDVQAMWQQSLFTIGNEIREIVVKEYEELNDCVKQINDMKNARFSDKLYRLVFDYNDFELIDVCGDFLPIDALDCPSKKYLSYGSSISSCSLTYISQISYNYMLAKQLGYDFINVGFSGSCRMEKEIVDYICNHERFDLATMELGINVIDSFDAEQFRERVHYLLTSIGALDFYERIYVIDIFPYFNEMCGVSEEKLELFRRIVKEETLALNNPKIKHLRGDSLLSDRSKLCADLVHPDIDGHFEIYSNLLKVINEDQL